MTDFTPSQPDTPNLEDKSPKKQVKTSYAIPCSSYFRDAVTELAERRHVNVGDLARSMMLSFPQSVIENAPDPGGPEPGDREIITLKSGPSEGKPWKRKPRLQVRLPAGYKVVAIRKALNVALLLDHGSLQASLFDPSVPSAEDLVKLERDRLTNDLQNARAQARQEQQRLNNQITEERQRFITERKRLQIEAVKKATDDEELSRYKAMIENLSSHILPHGIRDRDDALYVLGFPPSSFPDATQIKARFRLLATIHHPDSGVGNNDRMAQLNEAFTYLRRN